MKASFLKLFALAIVAAALLATDASAGLFRRWVWVPVEKPATANLAKQKSDLLQSIVVTKEAIAEQRRRDPTSATWRRLEAEAEELEQRAARLEINAKPPRP